MKSPELAGRATIVADATGLGAPVIEMIRAAKIPATLVPVVITGGVTASQSNGAWHVPRKRTGREARRKGLRNTP